MESGAYFELQEREDGSTDLVLSGAYLISTIGEIDEDVRSFDQAIDRIDLKGVHDIDTVGAWLAASLARKHEAQIIGEDERAAQLIEAVSVSDEAPVVAPHRDSVFERVPREVGERLVEGARHEGRVGPKAPVRPQPDGAGQRVRRDPAVAGEVGHGGGHPRLPGRAEVREGAVLVEQDRADRHGAPAAPGRAGPIRYGATTAPRMAPGWPSGVRAWARTTRVAPVRAGGRSRAPAAPSQGPSGSRPVTTWW